MILRNIITFLLIILFTLLIIALVVTVLIGGALGLGWLLTRVVSDFSLFEASLLILIALIFVLHLGYQIFRTPAKVSSNDEDGFEEDEEDYPIPAGRFYKSDQERTLEAWFRYEIANAIYVSLDESPKARGSMNDSQLKELSIRLIDLAVAILKRRPHDTPRITISASALRHEMERIEQTPYDAPILEEASVAINEEIEANNDLANVIRNKNWKQLMVE